jgi:hypothetical protein
MGSLGYTAIILAAALALPWLATVSCAATDTRERRQTQERGARLDVPQGAKLRYLER